MRGITRRWTGPLLALGLVAVTAGACGDGSLETTDATGSGSSGSADQPTCPFTADELGDALGTAADAADDPVDSSAGVLCVFTLDEGGGVQVSTLPDGQTLAERYENFEGDDDFEALPELGEQAFVYLSESSSTPASDDVLYDAEVYLDLDGAPTVVLITGDSNEEDRDAHVDAMVGLLG